MNDPLRLGVVRAYRAEDWPSMDLCADQLLGHLPDVPGVVATDLAPPFHRRFQRLPVLGSKGAAFNADRLLNRHVDLSRYLKDVRSKFDWFHVADHSYAMAAHALPPGRVGIYCHDLDAFRCLLDPAAEPRPWWFRRLSRRILAGLQSAAVVFHGTARVREAVLRQGLVDPAKLVHAPYGVAEEFRETAPQSVALPVPLPPGCRYLLHVGSSIPRKRLDVLLDAFAGVHASHPTVRLVQVGGIWTPEQMAQIGRLGLASYVVQQRGLSRSELAELYRRATAVLLPSEAEGFGLPVIEALACGAAVVASDIPVLREVGESAVVFRPVADVPAWAKAVNQILSEATFAPPRSVRLARAAQFSWAAHARTIGETYLRLQHELYGPLKK